MTWTRRTEEELQSRYNPKHWRFLSTSMKKESSSNSKSNSSSSSNSMSSSSNSSNSMSSNNSSSSINEISKVSFEAAVVKSSATLVGELSKPSSWVKYECLGRGSYASVYLARSKNTNDKTIRAIKSVEISRAKSLMYEKTFLIRLASPFVVGCYGHEIAKEKSKSGDREITNYNLILEYCSGESLADVIETGLSEKEIKAYARNILHGLLYIHSQNIIHCDIKPDNILLTPFNTQVRPTTYLTRIADFGLAMEKGSIEYGNGMGHIRGTTKYMAPELMNQGILDFGVDIWSFGCTVLEMLTGQEPWEEDSKLGSEDSDNLMGVSDLVPYIPEWLSEEAKDFLNGCLVKEAGLRWGIRELLDHPFVKMCA